MKSSFTDIQSSSKFPLDNIIGVLAWNNDFYTATHSQLVNISENTQKAAIPVFLIDEKKYIPVEFGKEFDGKQFFDTCFESYDNFVNLIERFSKVNFERVANPIVLETITSTPIDNRINKVLHGLIPLAEGDDLSTYKFNESELEIQKTFYELALASQELSNQEFINLDFHRGNIVKNNNSIVVVDPCLVKPYFRSRGNHISDRSLYTHYSPEVSHGGIISDKSQIYSVGAIFRNIISSEFGTCYENRLIWKKNKKIINACLTKKPHKRPSANELVSLLEHV